MTAQQQAMPELNDEQRRIVERIDGALLVLAPVGTGKTRVLAERALYAIQQGVPAGRVLCLTFTNRAAEQMRQRLRSYSGDAARKATIRTFHSLCAWFLRSEARAIGLPADFVIYDDVDSAELVAELWGYARADVKEVKELVGEIEKCKRYCTPNQLRSDVPWPDIFSRLGRIGPEQAMRYQAILQQQHALDFADLILFTRKALIQHPEIRQRWSQRYDFVQVDEVQDTNLSEYEIVHALAEHCSSIALIGDTDQTIYGWRGSQPARVLAQYHRDFQVETMPLTWNYRATRRLLQAADAFARCFQERATSITPAPSQPPGDPIRYHCASDVRQEGQWIGQQIRSLSNGAANYSYHKVAVLGRTNQRASTVAAELVGSDIPCITVDAFEFFRRQEVKDALAYLRLLTHPFDSYAVRRMVQRPRRKIGDATIRRIDDEGERCGLRLTDMALTSTVTLLDPFRPLIDAYDQGDVVVFDVETTGLAVERDEVVELAAIRLRNGASVDQFHRYLRPTQPVGQSEAIHGHSDAFLAAHGEPAQQVLAEFLAFADGAHLVGHNVGFDIKMISAQARRLGLPALDRPWSDTWNIAARFVAAENYRLETLARRLALHVTPTHKASDDVDTTVALLAALIPLVRAGTMQRQQLVAEFAALFAPLATQISQWRQAMTAQRPADLLNTVLDESGLRGFYAGEPQRLDNLQRLAASFHARDDQQLHPETSLRALLEFAALAKNMDLVSENDNQVVAITVHQAKGLEFDTVFIAGAVDNELPSYYSLQGGDVEEEKHLFYVAMTRAKQRLYISSHRRNERGFFNPESQFLHPLRSHLVQG
jgi:DNA helicase II / ATP-dependent DNA helicase PcrA